MKQERKIEKQEKVESFFCKKGKTVVARACPIVKSHLMDWTRENHKLLEKCKGNISFKGRIRE